MVILDNFISALLLIQKDKQCSMETYKLTGRLLSLIGFLFFTGEL